MVIGKGLVAGSFSSYAQDKRFLIFASGVSNSKTSTDADFRREEDMLLQAMKAHADMQLVYFSTTSVEDADLQHTAYVQHKLNMEELIRSVAHRYSIFRLSNLAGRSENPNTILNYFYQHISQGIPFQLWQHSERNIIDAEDVFRIADYLLQHGEATNQTVNIANTESYPVQLIVDSMEAVCGKKGIYTFTDKGAAVTIHTEAIKAACDALNIHFGKGYLQQLLQKYYSA